MLLVRQILFLAIFAWHLWLVNPRCVFYAQNDMFLCNWPFFRDFLMTPGGLAAWTGELALQACGEGWPGAAALTAIAWLVCAATAGFLRRLLPRGAEMAWAGPALVLLAVHGRYEYPLSASLGAALAMGAALGYVHAAARWPRWRIVWFTGFCAGLCYLAGAAMYVFVACAMIYEFYGSGSRWTKASLVVCAAAARCAVGGLCAGFHPGGFYFHVPTGEFFAAERSLNAYAVALYASFPLCALWLADRAARRHGDKEIDQADGAGARLRGAAATILFLAAAGLTAHLAVQRDERTVLALHDGAERQQWEEVLRLARQVAPKRCSQYVVHDVNLALYQTGRMPVDMFSYPQGGCPFASISGVDPHTILMRRLADFHLRLGRVNDAEYYAHEGFVLHPHAGTLRLLARIALVKGQTEVARLFLAVLRDEFTHGDWAEECLRRLGEDPALSTDDEVADIRLRMLTEEDIHQTTTVVYAKILAGMSADATRQIVSSLRQRPHNRMAFEFLMAIHLVNKDVKSVVQLLPQAAKLAYSGTPPLYEEAAVLCARNGWAKLDASGATATVSGCPISQETMDKVRELESLTKGRQADQGEIARVADELGLTYFRYYYGHEDAP